MKTYNRTSHKWINLRLLGLLILSLLLNISQVTPAAAQTGSVDWTSPVNLSRSGSALDPQMIRGSDGQFYAFWNDEFTGYLYATGNGNQWSDPVSFEAPFVDTVQNVTYHPWLASGPDGNVYAFWVGEFGVLYESHIELANLGTPTPWTAPRIIGYGILMVEPQIDPMGRIHLLLVQSIAPQTLPTTTGRSRTGINYPDELPPAGIYYQRSEDTAATWTEPVALYLSPYFRSLPIESANLELVLTNNGDRIYAGWDNPSRERVFASRSLDAGVTWEQPLEVDAPLEGSIVGGPNHVKIGAHEDQVVLLWQSDVSGVNCSLYYQWSLDGGATWQPRQRMLENLPGCPENNHILFAEDGTAFLMTSIQSQWYLLAWDGNRWSAPQVQVTLGSFIDPENFNPVDMGCRQPVLVDKQLYVLGCDEAGGQDIWFMSRSVDLISDWFTDAPAWNSLSSLTSSNQMHFNRPVLVADSANRIHALWSQASNSIVDRPGNVIIYARWEAGQWSTPQTIWTAEEGFADQPTAVVDANGVLLVAWRGGATGQIYFTQVPADRSVIANSWPQPVLLPAPRPSLSAPSLLIDARGVIHIAYTVPLNEQRGVYVSRSVDGGQNWLNPQMIFDATAAGWEMIDQARLASTYDGKLYLTWTRASLPGGAGPLGLYYSRSLDGGQTWSQPETVVDKPVLWSQIVGVGDSTVHRVWQELNSGQTTLWHEESLDGGVNWRRIAPVSIFGNTIGLPTLTGDAAGRLHLLQLVSRGTSGLSMTSYALQHWVYDGERWHADQNLDMAPSTMQGLDQLVAAVSPEGQLMVTFTAMALNDADGTFHTNIYFANRPMDVPESLPTPPPPPPLATLAPVEEPTQTPLPEVTPTPTMAPGALTVGNLPQQPGEPSNAWLGSVVGLLAAALIVIVVFIIGVRSVGLRRR